MGEEKQPWRPPKEAERGDADIDQVAVAAWPAEVIVHQADGYGSVAFRVDPGGKPVADIPDGTRMPVRGWGDGEWVAVEYSGQWGWVKTRNTQPYGQPIASPKGGPRTMELELSRLQDKLRVLAHRIKFENLEHLERLGKGSFGVVWRVRRSREGDVLAAKQPLPGKGGWRHDRGLRTLVEFLRESVNHAQMRSPAIVSFYGWGEDKEGIPAVFTELCAGDTLLRHLRRHNRIPVSRRLALAAGVTLGLSQALVYMHDNSWGHLDVAARNVLLATAAAVDVGWPAASDAAPVAAAVRLSDFGLTAPFGAPCPVVSIPWAPPESIAAGSDGRRSSAAHDVWGIGCVFVECITGQPPWFAESLKAQQPSEWMDTIIAAHSSGQTLPTPDAISWHPGAEKLWHALAAPCVLRIAEQRADAAAVRRAAQAAVDRLTADPPHDEIRVDTNMPYFSPVNLGDGVAEDGYYTPTARGGTRAQTVTLQSPSGQTLCGVEFDGLNLYSRDPLQHRLDCDTTDTRLRGSAVVGQFSIVHSAD